MSNKLFNNFSLTRLLLAGVFLLCGFSVQATTPSTTILAQYHYGSHQLLSLTENPKQASKQTHFYHTDALGSVVNLSTSEGTVSARHQYNAWGHQRYQQNLTNNHFGFTGHEHDEETQLIYAKARYLDPDTALFLSQDNWEGDTHIAPSLHRYIYAYQNPTVYVDPDGRKSVFGDATLQLGNFKDWLMQQNETVNNQLVAGAIGTAQFVTTLGEGVTRPLDIAANLAQVATGVDDQQVRDELAGTKQFISNVTDFVVSGNYAQAAKNAHQAAVNETSKAIFDGNVTATANITQGILAVATLRSATKSRPQTVVENPSGAGALVQAETQALKRIQSNVAKHQSLNERINQRSISAKSTSKELTTYFPPNNGFLGSTTKGALQSGQIIDRYGGSDISRFFSPSGTPVAMRALPPGVADQPIRKFEVLKSFGVESGQVAPAFNQIGLGTQFRTNMQLGDLLDQGFLREVIK